jgi:pyrophosphatase PpaX
MRFPIVLFDLDGTLIDSGPIILASFQHTTRAVLGREIPDAELLADVGGYGLEQQMRAFDPGRVEELVRVYREHNEPLYASLAWCDGMEPVLAELKERGHRLGIVSTKRRMTIELAFTALPLGQYFDAVVGSGDTAHHKPHPEPLLRGLEMLGGSPAEAAYIGDAPFDIQAAKAARMFAIAVDWGNIHPRERLETEEPDAIVDHPEELLAVL